MSESTACLSSHQLVELAGDELSPQRCAELEEHLSQCESCRQLLEAYDEGNPWLAEVRAALSTVAESGPGAFSAGEEFDKDFDAALHGILPLLGPTDDPRMMGRIGPYGIVGVLGRGGMGIVFKGFDPALNRYVAVKMLLPHLAATGDARKRFAREAQAAAAVVNDHVMAIHSVAEWNGLPFLVMPYGRGESLQKRLHDRGALELPEILRIGMQTAKGLAAAHAQGLVHRDVKPANILLSEGVDRVALTDFGLARAVDDIGLTREGLLAGTPQYMSPEQARGQPVDSRSDLFSLGCVLYVMCTGVAPFRAESSYAVLRRITDSQPQRIRALNPLIPAWLERIVEKLLSKDPAERYQSADELAELLERCLAHTQQPLIAPLPEEMNVEPSTTSQPFRGWLRLAAIGAVLLATISATWLAIALMARTIALKESAPSVARREEAVSPANDVANSVADGWDTLQDEFDAVDAEIRQLEETSREEPFLDAQVVSGEESAERAPADSQAPPGADLGDGKTISLVAVTKNGASSQEGWQPNGRELIDIAKWPAGVLLFSGDQAAMEAPPGVAVDDDARDLLFEFKGLWRVPSMVVQSPGHFGAYAPEPLQQPYRLRVATRVRHEPSAEGAAYEPTAMTFRIGFTDEPWGTWRLIGPDGKFMNRLDQDDPEIWTYPLTEVRGIAGNDTEPVLVLRQPISKILDLQVRCFDSFGNEYHVIERASQRLGNLDTKESEFATSQPLAPGSKLARFEYRLRRYRHWVTFENVSLHAGKITDVKCRIDKPPRRKSGLDVEAGANGGSTVGGDSESTASQNKKAPDKTDPAANPPEESRK